MVGVGSHSYSDYATQWLLQELVEDGDEVVCVRVLENDGVRRHGTQYRREAEDIIQSIVAKNIGDYAISIVLEYSVGKLHATFQQLVSRKPLTCRDVTVK